MRTNEDMQVVKLREDFYKDGFYKVAVALSIIILAIIFLSVLSVYLYRTEPKPVIFSSDNEWRILPPVPLDEVYLSEPDLIQWISEVASKMFTFDFINYTTQLKNMTPYFTTKGWQKFLDQVNVYANYNRVQDSKLFMSTVAAGAPILLNKGLLEGKYAWWIKMPINVNYVNLSGTHVEPLIIQILVVRVPVLNNLSGVGIENIIVSKGGGDQILNG